MFSIFFTDTPVRDYATALKGDAKLFARFFHACLDPRIGRVALVAFGLFAVHAALIAEKFLDRPVAAVKPLS